MVWGIAIEILVISYINSLNAKSIDWFLYDGNFGVEWVNKSVKFVRDLTYTNTRWNF